MFVLSGKFLCLAMFYNWSFKIVQMFDTTEKWTFSNNLKNSLTAIYTLK